MSGYPELSRIALLLKPYWPGPLDTVGDLREALLCGADTRLHEDQKQDFYDLVSAMEERERRTDQR